MHTRSLLTLALALASSACYNQAVSIHPLIAETISVPVAGSWKASDGDRLTFERREDYYKVVHRRQGCKKDGCDTTMDVRFGRLAGRLFADFAPEIDSDGDYSSQIGYVRVHAFARVELTKDRLVFSVLDRDWLRRALEEKQLALKYEAKSDEVVLTASTRELQQVLVDWVNYPDAFPKAEMFSR